MTTFNPIYGAKKPSIWQKWRAKGESMDDATFQRMIQGQSVKSVFKKSPFTGSDVIKNAIAGKLRDPNAPEIGFTKGMAKIPGFEGLNAQDEVDRTELQNQIQVLEQEQTRIEDLIDSQENKFSLFGWVVKLFNR